MCPAKRRIKLRSSLKPLKEDERYRSIFEYCPVSLWEEDISRLRSLLIKLKKSRGFDLRDHIAAHPSFVQEAVRLIEVTRVNEACVRLFEADKKEQLLGPLDIVLNVVSQTALGDTILAIDEGKVDIEVESSAVTLKGRKLFLVAKSHIPTADAVYDRMLVSLIDITARKEAEERERQNVLILQSIIESSPDMILVKDASLRMVLCNSIVSRAIGKEPKETYGKTDIESGWSVELIKGNPEKGIIGWEANDLEALSGKTVQITEKTSDHGGRARHFDISKFPLRDKDGTIIGLVGIGRDVTERRKAEAELREAKEFAENLINTANVIVLGLDSEWRVTLFNKTAEEITGYARSEIMNCSWFETVVPKERYPEVWRDFERHEWEGDYATFENSILTKSGEERHIMWKNNRIRVSGRVTGTLAFGLDITDRRRVEQDLAWERTLFNVLMDNVPDFIYFKDLNGRFMRVSRAHASLLRLGDPAEAVGKTDADFYSADHTVKFSEDEQRIIENGTPLENIEERETFLHRPDVWVVTTKMPLRDMEGHIVGTFGISHDITSRKQLEMKNQLLATLVDSADDAIMGLDLDRRITVWNRGAERLHGYSAAEMIGAATSTILPAEVEEDSRIVRERLTRGEQIPNFETTGLRKDGSKISVSVTLSAIRDSEGRTVGIASVARDITEQKAIQAQLNRAQRLESLATLAGGVAHQFNNINTVIGSYLELMRSDAGLPERLIAYMEAASVGVQRASDITNRLLVLTEPFGPPSNTVRLDVMARTVLPLYEKRIKEEKVHLVLNLDETPPVQGDGSRLSFVLSSIIGNALDSLLERSVRVVSVRTGTTKDSSYFEVEDSGCGISEKELPRIFSPFSTTKGEWALPGSPQGKAKGVGLSLAISYTIVSEYGGRIEVQSAEGQGSTFRAVMPSAHRQPGPYSSRSDVRRKIHLGDR